MLSLGIEYERAFSIAFWSARLPAGSGPPSLAATMIARESFEKSWPRFASAAPFLCLMLDHLLCPDTARLLNHRHEQRVDAQVVRELRMEGREQKASLANEHRLAVECPDHLDAVPVLANPVRPDELAADRTHVGRQEVVCFEAADETAERVPDDDQVHEIEVR